MFGIHLRKQKAGKPIAARTINRALAELSRQSKITASAPLMIQDTPTGPVITDTSQQPFWIKLTSVSGSAYAWTAQYMNPAGTWNNAVQTGTTSLDPAFNTISGVTITLPVVTLAQRSDDGTLIFSYGSC